MIGIHSLALINEGYKLSVILPSKSDALNSIKDTLKLKNKNGLILNILKLNSIDKFLLKLGLSKKIKNILNKADACFVHNAKLISIVKKNFSIPVFAVNHTAKFSQLKLYKKADLVFSVNKNINLELINLGLDVKKCIYCPNVLTDLPTIMPRKYSQKNITIGALGRMVHKKGFFDFIDALKLLKKKNFNFKAVLAGDGPLYKELKLYAADIPEIEFPGWITNKKDFFDKIDIFCQPSHFEPFGLTVIEAMAHAKPVISTNCDGPVEIINNDKKNGILVKKKNPSEMADAIISLINNSELCNYLSKSAYKHINEFYSISNLQNNLKLNINNYFDVLHFK